jgi:hypothetical protein
MTLILDEHHIASPDQGAESTGAAAPGAGPQAWGPGEPRGERAGPAPELLVAATASAALWLLVGAAVWRRISHRRGAVPPTA